MISAISFSFSAVLISSNIFQIDKNPLTEKSTGVFLILISIPGMLWCGYFPAWIGYITRWTVNHHKWTHCKLSFFCWFFFRQFSSALLVIMSVEKFIALYFPLKARAICTVKTAKWVSGIAFFIYALYDGQHFITAKGDKDHVCGFNEPFKGYYHTFVRVNGVLYSYAPFAIMSVANIAIIYKFVKAKLASKPAGTESTNQAMSNAAMRGTAILITVSVTFIFLTGPANITSAVTRVPNQILMGVLYLFVSLNHSINALLYCIVGTKFRKEFIQKLCWFGRRNVASRGLSMTSKNTSVSKISSSNTP